MVRLNLSGYSAGLPEREIMSKYKNIINWTTNKRPLFK